MWTTAVVVAIFFAPLVIRAAGRRPGNRVTSNIGFDADCACAVDKATFEALGF